MLELLHSESLIGPANFFIKLVGRTMLRSSCLSSTLQPYAGECHARFTLAEEMDDGAAAAG